MNKKIRKPIRRDVRKLGEGVNTFKKRHLLREAPDDIEYPVEKADWTEECAYWKDARDKLSKLMTPEEYRKLMITYNENENLIDNILYTVLESYEYTPLLLKWVLEKVSAVDLAYIPVEDGEDFFDEGGFSMDDFSEYFDYGQWYEDFKNGYISENNGFEIFEDDDNEYALGVDALLADADEFLRKNG